jgi:transposase-like protein
VARPPHDVLVEEIRSMSVLAVGRKYGVSDNAVRKWLRAYQREAELAGRESNPGSQDQNLVS